MLVGAALRYYCKKTRLIMLKPIYTQKSMADQNSSEGHINFVSILLNLSKYGARTVAQIVLKMDLTKNESILTNIGQPT